MGTGLSVDGSGVGVSDSSTEEGPTEDGLVVGTVMVNTTV